MWHGSSKYIYIFKSEEIFWNQKSRDESKAAFIWKEGRGTMGKLDTLKIKQKGRYVHKGKF
jgi:hypothetical protein